MTCVSLLKALLLKALKARNEDIASLRPHSFLEKSCLSPFADPFFSFRKSALPSAPPGPPGPPRFPIEIIQLIIHKAWALPLTTSERIQFTKSSLLVSLSWMSIFARESCIHVHLLSGEHTKCWYKPITSGRTICVYSNIAGLDGPTVRYLCRTITFHCIDPRDAPQPSGATHPTHPMCLTTNLISGIVRHGGFDNFEGYMTMQFPLTVKIDMTEEEVDWCSSHATYTVLTAPQFWQVKIASGITELYDVLEALVLWMMRSRWERLQSMIYDRRAHACVWIWLFIRYNADEGKVDGSMTALNAADYNIGINVGSVPKFL
ncbi:hypothetical protein BT96DRAFT_557401 [Gymnopus androsaceus JB14]|uniref:Uncharacterized protein n=1 Tax=Gymnopus androsaceus JB14 TaxID=1447944 RepID=A0A6A4I0H3_9AGAR|nr:hypothetical protein BT96DRAFT_557401 [Gymnopus androsaceus JB14]